jgi:pyruvate,water dikinase
MITMDSYRGRIFEGIVLLNTVEESKEVVIPEINASSLSSPLESKDNIEYRRSQLKTKIKLIVDLPQYASKALNTVGGVDKIDGVGLVRMEMIIATGGVHPAEYLRKGRLNMYIKLLKDGIRKIAQSMEGRPVWIRTSDLRSDEYRGLKGGELEPVEHDPMLGWHGIRRSIDDSDILRAEFIAISDIFREGHNVGIMIPFVINVEELQYAKKIMREDTGLEPVLDIAFGIMVETPAACWIIEEICQEGLSFISFGTNDLTQLSLGLDRNNEKLGKHFNEMHPAILGQMKKVLDVCYRYNVETSICGQAGSKETMAKFLVENHVTSISVNADAYEKIWKTIAAAENKVYGSN